LIRTGYSFRKAAGHIDEVLSKLVEDGEQYAPIADTASTFGWYRWKKAAEKKGLIPVFGVELMVTTDRQESKPRSDGWVFLAKDDITPVNDLVTLATGQFRYQPLLSVSQAMTADCFRIIGPNPYFLLDPEYEWVVGDENLFIQLSPATNKIALKEALRRDIKPIAMSCNRYPREEDEGYYEVLVGRNASLQTYPQHIMDEESWYDYMLGEGFSEEVLRQALANKDFVLSSCKAELRKASLPVVEWPKTIRQLCEEGAVRLKCDIDDPVYRERLEFEIAMIENKGFQDYFQIVADLVSWARERMSVGPARGSSCGSLVCYLVGITTVDPIPYGLLFARFLDFQRGGWFARKEVEEACKRFVENNKL